MAASKGSSNSNTLKLFSKSTLATAVSDAKFSCNPVIDLVASVGENGNALYVWRADEQMVAKHTERNQTVGALRWKADGQFLAAGWSDGVVRLIGLENSKALHQIRVVEDKPVPSAVPSSGPTSASASKVHVEFIAWARNHTGRRAGRNSAAKSKDMWREMLNDATGGDVGLDLDGEDKDVLDLPHALTFLEIDEALPKISPLPVSGGIGDDVFVFSTQASLEFVFPPFNADATDTVDVMVAGTSDGGIHLSIYDSFMIGAFKDFVRGTTKKPLSTSFKSFRLCGHGAHPDVSTHFLLMKPVGGSNKDVTSLFLVPMDLTFVHSSPINLSLLASKTTTLQNLLRYIKQTQSHIVGEWNSTRELPNRFLKSVQAALKDHERGPMNIVQALFHTCVTGHAFPQVKEWLVDSVAERGHKRWDKAVVTGLENLRALVHENFLPVLERCAIILSRLLGLARFHAGRGEGSIGFTVNQITQLLDIVSCLTMVGHKILLNVMDELDHFRAFSIWLRFQIDRLAASSSSAGASDELTEREATMDHDLVLVYIQKYLVQSPLAVYLEEPLEGDFSWDGVEDEKSRLEMLGKQLKRQEEGLPYMKALPKLGFEIDYLTAKAAKLFTDIAEAEKRGVRFGLPTELVLGKSISRFDVKVCAARKADELHVSAYTTILSKDDENIVYIFQTRTQIVNGISAAATTSICSVQILDKVVDLKFLDTKGLLVLCHAKDPSRAYIGRIPYQAPNIIYSPFKPGKLPEPLVLRGNEYSNTFKPMELTNRGKFLPAHMEVRGPSRARGEIPARVCLLGSDQVTYEVFALPKDWDEAWKSEGNVSPQSDVDME